MSTNDATTSNHGGGTSTGSTSTTGRTGTISFGTILSNLLGQDECDVMMRMVMKGDFNGLIERCKTHPKELSERHKVWNTTPLMMMFCMHHETKDLIRAVKPIIAMSTAAPETPFMECTTIFLDDREGSGAGGGDHGKVLKSTPFTTVLGLWSKERLTNHALLKRHESIHQSLERFEQIKGEVDYSNIQTRMDALVEIILYLCRSFNCKTMLPGLQQLFCAVVGACTLSVLPRTLSEEGRVASTFDDSRRENGFTHHDQRLIVGILYYYGITASVLKKRDSFLMKTISKFDVQFLEDMSNFLLAVSLYESLSDPSTTV